MGNIKIRLNIINPKRINKVCFCLRNMKYKSFRLKYSIGNEYMYYTINSNSKSYKYRNRDMIYFF
ncbi:hypothetical protein LTWDN19_15690 [Latilactobacillus curvatus]|uniref:Uncharacterized protein n=1 Tax=Latilactobacillus curvatus TaxID=28038 RepID=A0ABM7QVT6_LATCU|nr:hypothetical protein LTWDN19_15690 [Latilactobacillus curvatus]